MRGGVMVTHLSLEQVTLGSTPSPAAKKRPQDDSWCLE